MAHYVIANKDRTKFQYPLYQGFTPNDGGSSVSDVNKAQVFYHTENIRKAMHLGWDEEVEFVEVKVGLD